MLAAVTATLINTTEIFMTGSLTVAAFPVGRRRP